MGSEPWRVKELLEEPSIRPKNEDTVNFFPTEDELEILKNHLISERERLCHYK